MKADTIINLLKTVYPVVRPVIMDAIKKTDNEVDDTIFAIFDLLLTGMRGD